MKVLGVDVGGTGIKGAVVDVKKGKLVTDRVRIPTPRPATPEAVAATAAQIVKHLEWDGPVGATIPGVVAHGVIRTAPNLDGDWSGVQGSELLGAATGCSVTVLNDADAAGVAEQAFGAAADHPGVVMLLTLGTGIGSALLYHGGLVPNTELGHLSLHGMDAEKYCSELVRETEGLSWAEWAARLSEYLRLVEGLFSPDLFVMGGGVSKKPDDWAPLLECATPVTMATLRNRAGIVGAAVHAAHREAESGGRHKGKHKS